MFVDMEKVRPAAWRPRLDRDEGTVAAIIVVVVKRPGFLTSRSARRLTVASQDSVIARTTQTALSLSLPPESL